MHELAIAESILDSVRMTGRRSAGRPTGVGVRVGEVSGVAEPALRFAFDALVKGTELEDLFLEIERVEHVRRCSRCAGEFAVAEIAPGCPSCGESATEFVRGDELEIAWLEVEEPCHA
ncbi:MAG: hydrogenase maturation nickel metallochaperone HypA/HybF [Candidatus Eiseniibacteriota bacterium]